MFILEAVAVTALEAAGGVSCGTTEVGKSWAIKYLKFLEEF